MLRSSPEAKWRFRGKLSLAGCLFRTCRAGYDAARRMRARLLPRFWWRLAFAFSLNHGRPTRTKFPIDA